MILLYRLFLLLYRAGIQVASWFQPKAALWVKGRRGLLPYIKTLLPHNEKRIWMHCASLGEFEQGRPVLEAYRRQYPDHKIVLTFFSPSGYEVRKDYDGADYVFYLPMDSPAHARDFIDMVSPRLVIFVKYEFWHYYLAEAARRNIPVILISAAFRAEQAFFRWYGGFFRNILKSFRYILVQDEASARLLERLGLKDRVMVAGDTRYDRVAEIAGQARAIPEVEAFRGNKQLVIAGSTWPSDEQALKAALGKLPEDWKLILAPHETDAAHVTGVKQLFAGEAILFSEWKVRPDMSKRVLIIDNIGMLSALYRYGQIALVGGGFNKSGIHNVLEPAVFGIPVIIGPVYQKFVEAVALEQKGFVLVAKEPHDVSALLEDLIARPDERRRINRELLQWMRAQTGATQRILDIIARLYR